MSEEYPHNLCRGCGEDFNSMMLFDKHRVGKHAYTYSEGLRMSPPREDGRRCLSVDEIMALGWERNAGGYWHDPVADASVRSRFRPGRDDSSDEGRR